jgi:hypothetical protein
LLKNDPGPIQGRSSDLPIMSTLQTLSPQTFSSASVTPRSLGSDFPPQSQVYLFYLPVLLVLCAIGIWVAPSDASFVVGALVGGLVGVYVLLDLVFREAPLRFTTLYAMTLLVGYNLASFNSWLTLPRGGLTLAEFFSRDPVALARAMAACMACAALLLAAGQVFEPPLFGREFRLRFDLALPIGLISVGLLIIGYATGRLGYMGITLTGNGHESPIADLIMWWSIPAFAYSVCAALNTTGLDRWAMRGCALAQGLAIVPFGRRIFAFSLLLAILGTRLGEFRLRMPWFKKVLIGALAAAAVLVASLAFLYLRVAGYSQKGTTSISARVSGAVDTASRVKPDELLQVLGSDASSRFNMGFLSDLLDASERFEPLLGRDILYNMQQMVPSVISADKFGLQPYGEEEMANMQWGFSYLDEGNSLLTAGAADFGLVGLLLYPLLILMLMRVSLEWLQSIMSPVMATIITLSFISETLRPEDIPVAYFTQIRNALIVALLFYFASKLPRFRLRRAE